MKIAGMLVALPIALLGSQAFAENWVTGATQITSAMSIASTRIVSGAGTAVSSTSRRGTNLAQIMLPLIANGWFSIGST